MDIVVEGRASRFFKPDRVCINLNFYTLTQNYESALELGTKNVEEFVEKVFEKMNFSKEELKTRSFNIREENTYNVETKKYEFKGFSYSQTAKFVFDYDLKILSEFMELTSKLDNPPRYQISFAIKNEESAKSLVLADSYAKAEEKAKMIAMAAGKKLVECIKVDFRPFEEKIFSHSRLDETMQQERFGAAKLAATESIQKIFTPEDIEITETLFCLWLAE